MKETHTANPLSLEAFAEWCESKPADRAYNYLSVTNCACAQYARAVGVDFAIRDGFWSEADSIACDFAARGARDFGALASRLRAAISKATAPTA